MTKPLESSVIADAKKHCARWRAQVQRYRLSRLIARRANMSYVGRDMKTHSSPKLNQRIETGWPMKRFVEGDDRKQIALHPECVDDYIGQDNLVRIIDVFVDELDLEELGFNGATSAVTGRPSYHPGLMLKLYQGADHRFDLADCEEGWTMVLIRPAIRIVRRPDAADA